MLEEEALGAVNEGGGVWTDAVVRAAPRREVEHAHHPGGPAVGEVLHQHRDGVAGQWPPEELRLRESVAGRRGLLAGADGRGVGASGDSVAEGGATDTFTVSLKSQPSANVTITLNPGTQVTVSPSPLTFTAGNWSTPQTVTVTAVMMGINYDKLAALAQMAATTGANLRVNVYQPSKTDQFTLTYEQFWDGFTRLAQTTRLVATTEPVLAGVLGLEGFAGPACGRSTVRVAPDGRGRTQPKS